MFANLGLAIVDEQHRFGVDQRLALRAKSKAKEPHMLMMSATPIPRHPGHDVLRRSRSLDHRSVAAGPQAGLDPS